MIASDSFAYDGFLDRAYMFGDEKELAAKVIWVKSWSEKQYRDLVANNYKRLFESECEKWVDSGKVVYCPFVVTGLLPL